MFSSDLIARCRRNDRRAQMKLYDSYCDAMFHISLRYLKDEDDAKDVTQESFIKAFQRIDQYKGEVSFGAWLKRIVINRCIDQLKSKHQEMLSLEEGFLIVSEEEGNNWDVHDRISVEEIKEAIQDLPEKYRYVLMLYLFEGYDHQEIAQILQITENTSRTQLLRGKRKLKERIKLSDHGTGY